MTPSMKKRLQGTPEQDRAQAIRALATAILLRKRTAAALAATQEVTP